MEDFPKVLCGWSWEENKLFELALAVVDEQDPHRWEIVAAMVGGTKSAEDVQKHYVFLLEDLQTIESGKLDHKLGGVQPCVQVDCTQSVCWTDEDNKRVLAIHWTKLISFQGFLSFASGIHKRIWNYFIEMNVFGVMTNLLRKHQFD